MKQAVRLVRQGALGIFVVAFGSPGAAQTPRAKSSTAVAAAHPKVLIIYDMEGVSGVADPDYTRFDRPTQYALGRKSLTSDVNATIRGLAKGGAGPIWVQDGHGSGNTNEPDILVDQMDSRATFDFRPYPFDPYSTGIDGSVDAIVCIGFHARANTPGFEAHTYTIDVDFRVNDVEFSEVHIVGASAARWGIPVIMASGDNVLEEQLKPDFPELEYATVKTAKSHSVAEPLPPQEVDKRIETAAQQAMQKFLAGKFRPYYLLPPYDFRLSFPDYEEADGAAHNPLVERDGDLAVRVRRSSFVEGYEIAISTIEMALQQSQMAALTRLLSQDSTGRKSLQQFEDALFQRWLDREHAPDWSKPGPRPAAKKRFYGDT
jgi:D-amino peptidase